MPPKKECPPGKILNPDTGRCVNIDGKIGKQILKDLEKKKKASSAEKKIVNVTGPKEVPNLSKKDGSLSSSSKKAKDVDKELLTRSISTLEKEMQDIHKQQMNAMRNRNIPAIKDLAAKLAAIRKELEDAKKKNVAIIPEFLQPFIDPETSKLPDLPTIHGDQKLENVIKTENQLYVIDGMPYDILSLFELIQADISQGNVWGVNPYVRREGLLLPFDKHVKDKLLNEGINRKILPKNSRWIDHTSKSADDIEMRGYYILQEKLTPLVWMQKGWASDGTAFPTKKYYAITFAYPNKKRKQNPGQTAIFPCTKEAKEFIDKKLIPVFEAGALWSKKTSVTDAVEVINPNIHMIFEDNQPQRWYKNKMNNLNEEILKFAPAFA